MVYIVVALKAEALVFIEHFNLNKIDDKRFLIYQNSDIKLIISKIGKINSAIATTYLLSIFKPAKNDQIINIGLAGSNQKEINLGKIFEINKIVDFESSKVYHLKQNRYLNRASITSYDKVVVKKSSNTQLVDMESSGFYVASKNFFDDESITILKVVSDHLSDTILSTKKIKQLLFKSLKIVEDIM